MPTRQGGGVSRPDLPPALMLAFIKVIMPFEPKLRP